MAIRAVVFDIGGVLEYTPRIGVLERWVELFGIPAEKFGELTSELWDGGAIGKITLEEIEKQLEIRLKVSKERIDEFMADVWKEYLGTPNTELMTYIGTLQPDYKIGIISNSFVGAREKEEELYQFSQFANPIIYSHEVGISKPERRIYEITWEQLGVQPSEMIFVDDAPPNIAAANSFGIHGVLFKENAQAIPEIDAILKNHA